MINFVERNSSKNSYENRDYEYITISSQSSDYISLEDNVIQIENSIREIQILNKSFYDYKIVGIQNTLLDKDEYYVFTNSDEIIGGVKNCLTGRKLPIVFLSLDSEIESVSPSIFKRMAQAWCNSIKEYFDIEYNFYGTIKLNAIKIKERKMLDFTASGKGTTDEIVRKVKALSRYLASSSIYYNTSVGNMINVIREFLKS